MPRKPLQKSITLSPVDLDVLQALSLKGYRFLTCWHLVMLHFHSADACQTRMGTAISAFNVDIEMPAPPHNSAREEIIRLSRERYCRSRKDVESLMIEASPHVLDESQPVHMESIEPDAFAFLDHASDKPEETVSAICSALNLSGSRGIRIRKNLVDRGFLLEVDTRLGQMGRRAKYAVPTLNGYQFLGKNPPKGRGGLVHKHFVEVVARWAERKGYQVSREHKIDQGWIDLCLIHHDQGIAIELSVTSHALFFTVFYTGMRRGEVLALKWGDLDIATIYVNRSFQRLRDGRLVFREPKTPKARRQISMTPDLAIELRRHQVQQQAEKAALGKVLTESDLVFAHTDGSPLNPDTVTPAFKKLAKRAGLNLCLHDMRHSHATILLKKNVHPKIVSERLGHAKVLPWTHIAMLYQGFKKQRHGHLMMA